MKLAPARARTIVKELRFRNGFVTAVTRDFKTKEILMVAQQTKQAVLKTITSGLMHYWSRSRRKLWLKGERSSHFQRVRGVWVDCDGDALVYDVEQVGAACHEGYYSCFYRKLEDGKLKRVLELKFKPEEVYD